MPYLQIKNGVAISYSRYEPNTDLDTWISVSEDDDRIADFLNATVNPDWDDLLSSLRGSTLFSRAYAGGDESLAVQNAFTLIQVSLASSRNLSDLTFAFNRLRDALKNTSVGDFTTEELQSIASLLTESNFSLQGFNLINE
jgi:hypothetical protein